MKRALHALAMVLTVLVAGMCLLLLTINPNDFRTTLIEQVEHQSGYQMALDGNLRWHVWPQLSILSGTLQISESGANKPVVSAENARFNIDLWSLLSHKLKVNQVMLKYAVVRLTDESQAPPQSRSLGPNATSPLANMRHLRFDMPQIKLIDSLIIWQQTHGDEINFRHVNATINPYHNRLLAFDISANLARDDLTLTFSSQGKIAGERYPQQLTAHVDNLSFTINKASLPMRKLQGSARFDSTFDSASSRLVLQPVALTINNNDFAMTLHSELTATPQFTIQLQAANLDLNTLLVPDTQMSVREAAPTFDAFNGLSINNSRTKENQQGAARVALTMQFANVKWRDLHLQQLQFRSRYRQGMLSIEQLQGALANGKFSAPGHVRFTYPTLDIALQPELTQVPLQPILSTLNFPAALSGKLTLRGQLHATGAAPFTHWQQWQGRATYALSDVKFNHFDIQQMITSAIARNTDRVHVSPVKNSGIQRLAGDLTLHQGTLLLRPLAGETKEMRLQGDAKVDLLARQLDLNVDVNLLQWQGDERLASFLSQQSITFRLYGDWNDIKYEIPVEKIFSENIKNKLQEIIK